MQRAAARALLLLLLCCLASLRPAGAIDARCSACEAVAGELRGSLEADLAKKRDPLDYRGRLDSQGVRFGKVVDWRASEQRLDELLGGLPERLADYGLWRPTVGWVEQHPDDDAAPAWVKVQGKDAHPGAKEGAALAAARAACGRRGSGRAARAAAAAVSGERRLEVPSAVLRDAPTSLRASPSPPPTVAPLTCEPRPLSRSRAAGGWPREAAGD